MKPLLEISRKASAILAGIGLATIVSEAALGQDRSSPEAAAVEAGISATTLTVKSHQIGAGIGAGNLEGTSCPAAHKVISGACHPFYNDRVPIINQFPNVGLNTWRCGFKNNTSSTVTVWIYTLCGQSGLTDVVTHRLQVRRFTTTTLSNADADRILTDATTVLQTNDGTGDVACGVAMARDGDVTVFTTGDGSIDSNAEFNTLIGLPGHIKAVNQINWCGGLIPNVIGCAPVPGNSLAIVRFTPSLEGILWAHEFGHNKGLSHRNDDSNAVMNGTIASTRLRITSAECNAFRTLPAIALASETVMPQESESNPMDVSDFVRQVFIHGVPYEEASKYGPADVPKLLAMLNDRAEEEYWPNIVVVLGMIGDESAVDPLVAFIQADDERGLSRAHYTAKTSALMSLGYLINKTGNQKALDFLKEGLDPGIWAAKNVGVAPFQTSTTERDYDFAKFAILGLALSGRPEAAEALRALQQPAETETQRAFQAQVSDLVSEMLVEHGKVAEEGLENYYRNQEH